MHRLPKINYYDIERIIEFDFVRATEAAALNSLRWLGRGDKEAADAAACDAMRGMFDLMNICGELDQLYRGRESARRRQSRVARRAVVLHVKARLRAARDSIHAETRRFAEHRSANR